MSSEPSYHHGDLRAALLAEAAVQLEANGADALSLRALARTLGVSHAAPGHHFAGKTGLLSVLAADGFEQLADALDAAMDSTPPSQWRLQSGRAYVGFALAHPERYRLMFTSQLTRAEHCEARLLDDSSRAYVALLRAAYGAEPTVDPDTYQLASPELQMWSTVHGAVMLWLDGQLGADVSKDEFLARMEEVLIA